MKLICLTLICSFSIGAFGQDLITYNPTQMHSDLNKFKFVLEYAHPDLYAHTTPVEFEAIFKNLISSTSEPKTALEFHNIVLQLIASLHDGHSRVFANNKLRSYINKQQILPFHTLTQNGRIFITRNLSGQEITDGSEIISINGFSSDKITQRLLNYFGGDGLCQSCIEYRFGSSYNSFYRVYPLVFGFNSVFQIVFRDYGTKEIKVVDILPISYSDFRSKEHFKYGNNLHTASIEEVLAQKAFDLELDSQGQYGYLKINRFYKDDYEEPSSIYSSFYESVFKQINEEKINNLIIDLRGNGGGIGSNAAYLIQYLTDRPFTPTKEISTMGNDQYYKQVTNDNQDLDLYFGLKQLTNKKYLVTNSDNILELKQLQPVKSNHFNGNTYVLIDGGTLSAAAMAAGLLREYSNAIFVGQETGGHAGMSNGIRQLSISGDSTDVSINFPLLHSEFSIDKHIMKRGVVPDYLIQYNIHDVIQGRDSALEFVLNTIKNGKSK